MKRFIVLTYILVTSLCLMARDVSYYHTTSALSHGTIVKLQVAETGLYSLSYEDIQRLGLKPDSIRVLGYGGNILPQDFSRRHLDDVPSVAFYMHKGEDGKFNKGDYIVFYAQGPVGWDANGSSFTHTRNSYSNYGYYFLSDEAGEQRLITEAAPVESLDWEKVDYYMDHRLHEIDKVNLVDISGKEGGGREFYGESMTVNNHTLSIPFTFAHIDTTHLMQARIALAASSSDYSTFTIRIGEITRTALAAGIDVSDFYTKANIANSRITSIPQTSNSVKVDIDFANNVPSAKAYLNYIELIARCRLIADKEPLFFRNIDGVGSYSDYQYRLIAPAQTQVWDLTYPDDIHRVPTSLSGDTLCFISSNDTVHEYVAVCPEQAHFLTPTIIGTIPNQNLHSLSNIDYVIVAPQDFYEDAVRLAKAHEQVDHLTWAVVTDQQVYNEFSSGTPDVSAIRWLMKMLYDRAEGDVSQQPKNLLLFGQGTFDNRKLLHNSGFNTLLTYQAENSTVETKAYATDDYFAFMGDKEGMSNTTFSDVRGRMAFGVGRIPASNQEQAANAVNKIITYMTDLSHGNWRQQLCFLADDGDHGLHVDVSDVAAESTRVQNPGFIVNKIYLDAYTQEANASGESYPLAYNQFSNLMQNGMLFMDYSGHGSANNICSEGFLTLASVQKMTNANLAFWALATCNFAHFDQAETCSAGAAVLNPYGGAIGVFSADRTVYASNNKNINMNLCDTLFGHRNAFHYDMTLGQACAAAKNMTGNDDNKLPYVLLGDPAVKLAYPTQYEVVSTSPLDTLNALEHVRVEGYIRAEDNLPQTGDTATWFNGRVTISVYDKLQRVTTRDNDEPNPDKKQYYTYNDHPNCLFKGETQVTDGHFTAEFMLPKDIRYNYGEGRIVFYALDTLSGEEGIGYDHSFTIGGSSPVALIDSVGPDLTLYLNDPLFSNGGKTNETPHFYADIYDENGINTVGSGIGHDLMLVVDNDPVQTYTLNDYFTAQLGNYRQGRVSYRLAEMAEGQHSLTFRAWDLLNNSSTASLQFEVVPGLDVQLFRVLVYPNPVHAEDVLHLSVNHDKPDDWIHTCLRIYNVSGQLVRVIEQDAADMTIPMSQLGLSTGVYIYQLNIKTASTGYTTRSSRLIVL